jgi:hypothetical protein
MQLNVNAFILNKISIIWDIKPCSPLEVNRSFETEFRLHIQDYRVSLRNVDPSRIHSVAHPITGLNSFEYFLWEYVRHVMYWSKVNDLPDRRRIVDAVASVTMEMLSNTRIQIEYRLDIRPTSRGGGAQF